MSDGMNEDLICDVNILQRQLKRYQLELEAVQTRFYSIIGKSADGIVVVTREGIIKFVNPAAEELLGRSRADLLGEVFGLPLVQDEITELDVLTPNGITNIAEMRVATAELDGDVSYLASLRDITEKRRVQYENRRFRIALDSSADSIFLIDRARMRFVDVNDTACRTLGYSREELLAMGPQDIKPDYTRARLEEIFDRVIAGDLTARIIETVHHRKDAADLPVEVFLRAQKLEGQYLLVASARDITARKRLQEQLRNYTQHLERLVDQKVRELEKERARAVQAAKLAALGEMATEVAHELNQPLSAMLFEADYLRSLVKRAHTSEADQRLDLEELYRIGGNLKQDITRCRRMTDYLRTFGNVMDEKVVLVDINVPFENSFTLIGERLRFKGVTVQQHFASKLPLIQANPYKLEHVFLNLLSNAEQALNEMQRRITSGEAYCPDYQKVLQVSTFVEGEYVYATVADNGCGIAEADQPHIFEPFFSRKISHKGLGVGLSAGLSMISELEGEITFESKENEGTTFRLRFPIAEVVA